MDMYDMSWLFSGFLSFLSIIISIGGYIIYALGVKKAAEGVGGLKVPVWCAWIPFAQYVLLADIIAQKGPKKLAGMELHIASIVALAASFVLSIISCGILFFLPWAVIIALHIMFVYYYAPEDKKVLYYILMVLIYPVGMFLAPKAFGLAESSI